MNDEHGIRNDMQCEIDDLRALNAELLAALQAIASAIASPDNAVTILDRAYFARDMARAAIAKAEAGA